MSDTELQVVGTLVGAAGLLLFFILLFSWTEPGND